MRGKLIYENFIFIALFWSNQFLEDLQKWSLTSYCSWLRNKIGYPYKKFHYKSARILLYFHVYWNTITLPLHVKTYNYQKATLEINSIIKFVSSYIAEINLYLS